MWPHRVSVCLGSANKVWRCHEGCRRRIDSWVLQGVTGGCSLGRWFSRQMERWRRRVRIALGLLHDTWFPRGRREYFNDEREWVPFPPLLAWLAWLAFLVAWGFDHWRQVG